MLHARLLPWHYVRRPKLFFWESVVLFEKLALALAVVAMQRYGAAPQVIVAHAVLSVSLLLQWHYSPYACRMLDTMQRRSLYALIATCFTLMAPALDGLMQLSQGGPPHAWVLFSALAVAGLINLAVVGLFAYAKEGKGHLTWGDVKSYALALAPGCLPAQSPCLGGGGAQRRGAQPRGAAEA